MGFISTYTGTSPTPCCRIVAKTPGGIFFPSTVRQFQFFVIENSIVFFAGFCAIIVFSGTSRSSLEDVESKWIPLLKDAFEDLPCPPFVLLATDSGSDDWVVDRDEATAVATRIGALENRVFECTLENGDGVLQAAFETVVVAGLEMRRAQRLAQRAQRCNIL